MKWITTTNLDAWGATRTSETELPGLVSDLIRATAPDINAMRFPTGEKGQVRGFDGTLDSSIAALNIPAGRSYWEFGTERDYQNKALRDFRKRTSQVSAAEQAASTLVLVTPFTWDSSRPDNKIEDWESARQAESHWKSVKLIDGQQLEDWLAQCPAASAWHARNTLRVAPKEGVRSTDEYWYNFADRFDPRLLEEMLTKERGKQVDELLTGLMGPAQPLRFVGDSPDDVTAFAIAAIRTAKPEVKLFLEARTLVVETAAAVRELVGRSNLVFLARGEAARAPGQLSEMGPTLVPLGRQQRSKQGVLLERPSSFAMASVLKKMNYPAARAEALAKGCGRSLTALARQIPGGTADRPLWVDHAGRLLPAILAGAWDGANPLDQQVVSDLAGANNYTEYESSVRQYVDGDDPALDREGTIYKIRAPMDAFIHAGYLIGSEHLTAMLPVLARVFGELAPDLSAEATFHLSLDRPPRHSDWLREGLATTLLLVALWQENAYLSIPSGDGQRFANEVIGSLPGLSSDERLLMSLRNEIPVLAEAAPDVFLSALEQMLEGDGAAIRPIFNEVEGFAFPTSHHTGVLWALEALAWDHRRFRRVCLVLVRLAEIDPGGKLANRPISSLTDIFLPWNPGTLASLEVRIAVIDEILGLYPNVSWKLLLRLLPGETQVSTGTARPKLREADSPAEPPTRGDVVAAYIAIIDRAITAAEGNVDRVEDLVKPMTRFGREQFNRMLLLIDRTFSSEQEKSKERLWITLRDTLRHHEKFSEAEWAMPPEALTEVRRIVTANAPTDPIVRMAALFDMHAIDEDDVSEATARADAMANLYRDYGATALMSLVRTARTEHLAFSAIDAADLAADDIAALIRSDVTADPSGRFATPLSAIYYRRAGKVAAIKFVTELVPEVGIDVAALMLLGWPMDRKTWRVVHSLGPEIEGSYWRHYRPRWIDSSRRTLLELLVQLLARGRAIAALETALNRLDEVPTRLLFRALDGVFKEIESGHAQVRGMLEYEIERILTALDRRDADENEIAKREYALLPLLEHQERPLRLHKLMISDPMFFHSILRDVYRAESDEALAEEQHSENDRARWRQAYQLLSSIDRVPGFDAAGPRKDILADWISRVRELGVQHDRAIVTEIAIGQILAHASLDDVDEAWPHRFVRDEIEGARSDDLERGIQIERYNMRGVTTRGMFDGGDQERELVKKYEGYARSAQRWPRTAAMLVRIADEWRRQADREDAEVRERRLRS